MLFDSLVGNPWDPRLRCCRMLAVGQTFQRGIELRSGSFRMATSRGEGQEGPKVWDALPSVLDRQITRSWLSG